MTDLDVVYFCRAGENEELRFSLRSLGNMPVRNVWVFGAWPSWYTGPRVRVSQNGFKHEVTDRAMTAACEHPEISDRFVMMNDDFYVMKPGGLPEAAHMGPIAGVLARYAADGITPENSGYLRRMRDTLRVLHERGIQEPLSYELHTPMVVDKLGMLGATRTRGQQRSMYGNLARLGGKRMADVKVYGDEPLPRGRWLSTSDRTIKRLAAMLAERFPDPSPWETG